MTKTWILGLIAVLINLALYLVDLNEVPARWFVAALVGISVATIGNWLD